MQELNSWALCLCSILLITAIISFLVPQKSVKKTCDAVFLLIILSVFFQPFFKMKSINYESVLPNIDISYYESIDLKKTYDLSIEKAISEILKESDISYESIEIDSDIEDKIYSLNKVLLISDCEDKNHIVELLSDKLKIDPDIISVGE